MEADPTDVYSNLAFNLQYFRKRRHFTQALLAKLCKLPRSTISHLESGIANPSLQTIQQLSLSLQISVGELISPPHGVSSAKLYEEESLQNLKRTRGKGAEVTRLIPENLPAIEVDRIHLKNEASFSGVPHKSGTREYLFCEKGALQVAIAGEVFDLSVGDVLAFDGDQKHSYKNIAKSESVGISIVTGVYELYPQLT